MLKRQSKQILTIQPAAFIVAAASVLLCPSRWIVSLAISILFHELCHYFAIYLLNYKVTQIRIGLSGITISTEPMSTTHELICALSGPLGSAMLVLFYQRIPKISICALLQLAFNILPIYPLDGGRIVKCCLGLFLPEATASRVMCYIGNIMILLFVAFSMYVSSCNSTSLLSAIVIATMLLRVKIPCKESKLRLQ